MPWRFLLEEFGPRYEHAKGKDNVVADNLSRMEASQVPVDSTTDVHAC